MDEPPRRPYPHDLDAERSVLGAVLLDQTALRQVADLLEPADFYRDAHRQVYLQMCRLDESRHAIDFVTLHASLKAGGLLESVGGPAYVSSLVDGVPKASNVRHYAGIIKEHAKRRLAIETAATLTAGAFLAQEPAAALAATATDALLPLSEEIGAGPIALSAILHEGLEALEQARTRQGGLVGRGTGLTDLDALTMGLHDAELPIVAGRTSQGKSALALTIALEVAKTVPVLSFSLEMSDEALGLRAIASEARIDSYRLRGGYLSDRQWGEVSQAMCTLNTRQLWIDDAAGLTVSTIRARAASLDARVGLGLIVVDYLQLVHGRGENRTQQVGSVARGLKAIAKELQVPVIACAQLNRAADGRSDKRPQLSDLRESGDIENEADTVLLLWRQDTQTADHSTAELIVGKQRNGPLGTIRLAFIAEQTRFANLERP